MKKSYLSLGLAIAIATSFYSCKKKTEEQAQAVIVSKEEATTVINTQSERTYNDIVDMTKSEGVTSINNAADFVNQHDLPDLMRISDENKAQQVLSRIKKYRNFFIPSNNTISIGRTSEDGGFDFNGHKGVYSWNPTSEKWDTTSLGGEVIKIQFPSDSTKTTNDATLTISKYSEIAIANDSTTADYMPTEISAALTVNSVKMAGVELTASYNSNGYPTNLSAAAYFKPYSLNTKFSITGSNIDLTSSIDKDNENGHVISEGLNVTMGDIDNMEEPQKVNNAYFQFRDIKVAGSADIKGMEADSDTSDVNKFNKYVSMSMYNGAGNKLATFNMMNVNNKQDLYLVYNDGTKELAESFFKKHLDKLQDFIDNDLKLKK